MKMVKHYDLAKSFANGATKGTASRMFIEGKAIYSYGKHFPIAARFSWGFLFNSDGYSQSTSKHKSYVHRALMGTIVECNTEQIKLAIDCNDYHEPIVIVRDIHKPTMNSIFHDLRQVLKERGVRMNVKKIQENIENKILVKTL
jgi:hypothetical protein